MCSNLDSLPLRAFRHFTVTEQDIRPAGEFVKVFGIQCHAKPYRKSLSERPCGSFDIVEGHSRVTFQRTLEFSHGHEFLFTYFSSSNPQGVEKRRGMTFREYKAI